MLKNNKKSILLTLLMASIITLGSCSRTNTDITTPYSTPVTSSQEKPVTPSITPLESITLEETKTLVIGDSYRLIPTLAPENTSQKDLSFEYVKEGEEKPEEIVSLATDGTVFARKEGVAKVRAVSKDNPNVASNPITITVTNKVIPLGSITIAESGITLDIGETRQITPEFTPKDTTQTNVSLAYVKENDNERPEIIASLNGDEITAKSEGTIKVKLYSRDNSDIESNVLTIKVVDEKQNMVDKLKEMTTASYTAERDTASNVSFYQYENSDGSIDETSIIYDIYTGPHTITKKTEAKISNNDNSITNSVSYKGFNSDKSKFYEMTKDDDENLNSFTESDPSNHSDYEGSMLNLGATYEENTAGVSGYLSNLYENSFSGIFPSEEDGSYSIKRTNDYDGPRYEIETNKSDIFDKTLINTIVSFDAQNRINSFYLERKTYSEDDFYSDDSLKTGAIATKVEIQKASVTYDERTDDPESDISITDFQISSADLKFVDSSNGNAKEVDLSKVEVGNSIYISASNIQPVTAQKTDELEFKLKDGETIAQYGSAYSKDSIKAIKEGSFTFTVVSKSGSFTSEEYTVTVSKARPKEISFGWGVSSSLNVNETMSVTAEITPDEASQDYTVEIKEGQNFATLTKNADAQGYTLTGKAKGKVVLLAKSVENPAILAEKEITINAPVTIDEFESFIDSGNFTSNTTGFSIAFDKTKKQFTLTNENGLSVVSTYSLDSSKNLKADITTFTPGSTDYERNGSRVNIDYLSGKTITFTLYDSFYEMSDTVIFTWQSK